MLRAVAGNWVFHVATSIVQRVQVQSGVHRKRILQSFCMEVLKTFLTRVKGVRAVLVTASPSSVHSIIFELVYHYCRLHWIHQWTCCDGEGGGLFYAVSYIFQLHDDIVVPVSTHNSATFFQSWSATYRNLPDRFCT